MDDQIPVVMLISGIYLGCLLQIPKFREAFEKIHPLPNRARHSEKAAFWMVLIGGLWTLQNWLQ